MQRQALAFVFIVASVQVVVVEGGVITGGSQDSCKLFFHKEASKNAVVTNSNTSAHMLNDEGNRPYAAVWTNRHLKSDELFEVNFEKMEAKNESIYLLAIGVTNITHDDIDNIQHVEPREWMMQWIIKPEDDDDSGFQKFLKSGIKFGIMRKGNGNLDIFVNGVNEGTIYQGVQKSVYGVIELLTGGLQATIVSPSSTLCQ